ncbi:UNVERIFIED_CONTAM: hypothetical protein GTU68_000898 [Idotea baltica]|nr:hypothetical protein [Idotea baltica]
MEPKEKRSLWEQSSSSELDSSRRWSRIRNRRRRAVEEIAPVHKTLFGEMWTVENNYKFMDTAYSTEFLGAHTDCTYLTEACRIQNFHCLKMAEEGGETLLVDGFHIAEELRKSEPKSYDYLSSHAIPSEYMEEGKHYKSLDLVFKHHPVSKRLKQFRFNLYDRAPLSSLPFDQIDAYYRHLQPLVSRVRKPSNEFWIKLEPGQVLFIDNWRVMHGRNQFRGPRLFSGCYLGNAEFLSKARVLGFGVD